MRPQRFIAIVFAALVAALLPLGAVASAEAQVTRPSMSPDWWACVEAAQQAQVMVAAPDQLLTAIALNETGRRAPNRALAPWPWTINVGGRGYEFATKDQAIFAARQLLNSGNRSFDVGCMQVNVRFHPRAFTSLEEAFDPLANMLYAADYIDRLQARHGSWARAVELYHSYNDEFNQAYGERFQAFWDLARRRAARGDILMGAHPPETVGEQAVFLVPGESGLIHHIDASGIVLLHGLRTVHRGPHNGLGGPAPSLTSLVTTFLISGDGAAPFRPRFSRAGLGAREAALLRQVEQRAAAQQMGS